MQWLIIWGVACVVFLIVEAFTMGLTTIWFAGGALAAVLVAALHAPVWFQILVFAVVSLVLLVFTRPIATKYFNKRLTKTNVEDMEGKKAYVEEEIDNIKATGRVKINGMDWTARTKEDGKVIPVGKLVTVVAVEGVKVIVEESEE